MTISELEKLFEEIYQPIIKKLIKHNLDDSVSLWREKYELIKDPAWPPCNNIEDFNSLPDWIQRECVEIHQFSSDLWKQQIYDDANLKFELPPSLRQQTIISDNLNFIANKNIVDFACRHGGYSFASWKNGANTVVGFDIRDDNLKLANAIKEFLKVPDGKIQFLNLDIHNYEKVTALCRDKDTVLVPGIMYHVHDHFQILLSIAKANVSTVIFETGENSEIVSSKEPLVWWRTEKTFENISGWVDNYEEILVGYPNPAWFELVMNQLGYVLLSSKQHTVSMSQHHPDEFNQIRSVHVYGQIKEIS
jgi:2-polyprenyl-3-methyl-5-hydroxy-6-metoxy-1,4-benzoquinol methylase